MSARILAYDTETTGLSCADDEIISVAMILLNGKLEEIARKVVYAYPDRGCGTEAAAVNGYTREKWAEKGAVDQAALYGEVRDFLKGQEKLLPLGQNIVFDIGFMKKLFADYNDPTYRDIFDYHFIDTMNIAVFYDLATFGEMDTRYKLKGLCDRFGVTLDNEHDALADVEACVDLIVHMYKALNGKDMATPPPKPQRHSRLMKKEGDTWVMTGGKHKDKDVRQVYIDTPRYISWMLNDMTDLSSEQDLFLRQLGQPQRALAQVVPTAHDYKKDGVDPK